MKKTFYFFAFHLVYLPIPVAQYDPPGGKIVVLLVAGWFLPRHRNIWLDSQTELLTFQPFTLITIFWKKSLQYETHYYQDEVI